MKRNAAQKMADLDRRYFLGEFDPWTDNSPEEGLTLDEAIDRYIDSRRNSKRPATIRSDFSMLRTFCTTLSPGIVLNHIHNEHISSFMAELRNKGKSSATQTSYYTRLSHFFNWCVISSFIKSDPTTRIERPKLTKKEKRILTKEQFNCLLREIKKDCEDRRGIVKSTDLVWLHDLLVVTVQTGLRVGEVCAMCWNWIDLENQQIVVRRSAHFVPKRGHERTIPIRGEALAIVSRLSKRLGFINDADPVFPSSRGQKGDSHFLNPTYVSKRFLYYCRQVGLPKGISFHSLRHSFCTWMIAENVPVPVVQRLAGHADITTTMGYVHVVNADLHSAVERVFSSSL